MLSSNDWKYYNHSILPTTAPNVEPDLSLIKSNKIWKEFKDKKPLLIRWTTDFDCGYETDWWYCIKDTKLDISKLNSSKRYDITKGNKNFEVRQINPIEYKEELLNIEILALQSWPKKYRPNVNAEKFKDNLKNWSPFKVFGAFERNTNQLVGYATNRVFESYTVMVSQRVIPKYEKLNINAAIVFAICMEFNDKVGNNFFILDGERSINHQTNFQTYLEKLFGFRKAYCKLHIIYSKKIHWLINFFYLFRKILYKFDKFGLIHKVNGILKMEEIVRKQRKVK